MPGIPNDSRSDVLITYLRRTTYEFHEKTSAYSPESPNNLILCKGEQKVHLIYDYINSTDLLAQMEVQNLDLSFNKIKDLPKGILANLLSHRF